MKLEEMSLWYQYKTKVWLDEKNPVTPIVHNIMRILRSIRGTFNYISTPITSGKLAFDNPFLNKSVVINENIINGYNFAERLGLPNMIIPSELLPTEHFKWGQDDFQALWLSVIAEKCHAVFMNKDWEYSNGCSEELVHTFQLRLGVPTHDKLLFFNTKEKLQDSVHRMKNIDIYDHTGHRISIGLAIKKLEASSALVKSEKLNRAYELLVKTREMMKCPD